MAARHDRSQYGGYEYEFVEEVPEKYTCSAICTKVLRDPHLTACCGKHFCESCLQHWFRTQKREICPHCREENFGHFLDKSVKREIDVFKIRCTNRKAGCKWVGVLSAFNTHLTSEKGCGYVEVYCSNMCKKCVKRKDLADHLSQHCTLRKYRCRFCGIIKTFEMITKFHYVVCGSYPLDCPNAACSAVIKRAEMGQHRKQCPFESVECTNKCNKLLKRKDLASHLTRFCYLRRYKCQHCANEDTYLIITGEHYDECPNYPLDCPNACGARGIKRAEMGQHRNKCPLEPVRCPFHEAGCQSKLVRRGLDGHIATYSQQHLLLMMNVLRTLKKGISNVVDHLLKSCTPHQVGPLQSIQSLLSGNSLRTPGDQIIFKIPDIAEDIRNSSVWQSPPFYYKEGYKMRLDLSIMLKELMVSCSLHLLEGEFDDELDWPITNLNTIEIHVRAMCSNTTQFPMPIMKIPTQVNLQRPCALQECQIKTFIYDISFEALKVNDVSITVSVTLQ